MSFSETHQMSTAAVNELAPRVVRPYAGSENKVVHMDTATHHARLVRIIGTSVIDAQRYAEAGQARPDMASHFEHLATDAAASELAWANYFSEHYGVDATAAIAEAQQRVDASFAEQDQPARAA
jgi:hypothetical protein